MRHSDGIKNTQVSLTEIDMKYLLNTAVSCCELVQWCERNAHAFQKLHWLHSVIVERQFNVPVKYKHTQVKTQNNSTQQQ